MRRGRSRRPTSSRRWHQLGLLAWTPDLAKLPKLVDPYDESADLDRRARSYLQTNCAHCHQFNAGGTANIALGYDVPLEATKTVGDRPIQGTFNIAGARIIAPGDPAGSVLYYRMSKLGGGRMPRIGSNAGRRARHPDDPRLDRRDAARQRRDVRSTGPPRSHPKIATRSSRCARPIGSRRPPARRRSVGWRRRPAGP